MKPTLRDFIGGADWQRAKALADCKTEADRRVAIRKLLGSHEIPLGSFTRKFIAEYLDLHGIDGGDWRRAKALEACKTEAARRVAIHKLLTSSEIPLGAFTRKLIAEYFQQGRPRKDRGGVEVLAVAVFVIDGKDRLRGKERTAAIREYCKRFKCSRASFRKYSYLIDSQAFRFGLAREPAPPGWLEREIDRLEREVARRATPAD